MTTKKHTPGPWEVLRTRTLEYGVIQGDSDVRVVDGELSEPDARLIAAAPEMAEALLAAREEIFRVEAACGSDGPLVRVKTQVIEAINAALKKAGVL